jgi:hypothetical protein
MREEGYYWVKFYEKDEWQIVSYNGTYFFSHHYDGEQLHKESDIYLIHGKRILDPDEQP